MKQCCLLCLLVVVLLGMSSPVWSEWHMMKPGDNLWDIAARTYGDPGLYVVIANFNGISSFRAIPVGKAIWLPSKAVAEKLISVKDEDEKAVLLHKEQEKRDESAPPDSPYEKATIHPIDPLREMTGGTAGGEINNNPGD